MSHNIVYLQEQAHERLTFIIVAGSISGAIVLAFVLYLHWKGRHARRAERLAREERKAESRRRRRGKRRPAPN